MAFNGESTNSTGNEQSNTNENRKKLRTKESAPQEKYDSWADDSILPEEHYKPQRSRFRGGAGVNELVESIDFSKRPEAAIKTRKKLRLSRQKTTGGAIVVHVDGKGSMRGSTLL